MKRKSFVINIFFIISDVTIGPFLGLSESLSAIKIKNVRSRCARPLNSGEFKFSMACYRPVESKCRLGGPGSKTI